MGQVESDAEPSCNAKLGCAAGEDPLDSVLAREHVSDIHRRDHRPIYHFSRLPTGSQPIVPG
jgi:hypothetical protein